MKKKKKSKTKASDPITSRQIEGGQVEAGTIFLFLVSKIIPDRDCSCEIKRRLLLGKKVMNLDSMLKPETSVCWQRSV